MYIVYTFKWALFYSTILTDDWWHQLLSTDCLSAGGLIEWPIPWHQSNYSLCCSELIWTVKFVWMKFVENRTLIASIKNGWRFICTCLIHWCMAIICPINIFIRSRRDCILLHQVSKIRNGIRNIFRVYRSQMQISSQIIIFFCICEDLLRDIFISFDIFHGIENQKYMHCNVVM